MSEFSHFTADSMRKATAKARSRQAAATSAAARRRADVETERHKKARTEAIALFPKYQKVVQDAAGRGETKVTFDIRLGEAAAWLSEPTEDQKALLHALVSKFKDLGFKTDYTTQTEYGTGSDPGPPSHRCDLILRWEA